MNRAAIRESAATHSGSKLVDVADDGCQAPPQNLVERKANMKRILVLTVAALAATALTARAGDAKETFEKQCVKCHGAEGKGDTKMGKKIAAADFTDPKVQEKFTDEQMFKAIKEGIKDQEGKIKMKPAENVTDDEIKALIKLVRAFKK